MSGSTEARFGIIDTSERVPEVGAFGIRAFTTTRDAGSFGTMTDEPVSAVTSRWSALRRELGPKTRFATASQVHGASVIPHRSGWHGWLRVDNADGHVTAERGTGLAVTVADCVPVFIAHPSGVVALLHSGWRGTAARIVEHGIDAVVAHGVPANELYVHCGPAICGKCYEVSGSVYAELTGTNPGRPTLIDLRALIADHARARGVRHISSSPSCTKCDNDRFFSHRAGNAGRQLGVIIADLPKETND